MIQLNLTLAREAGEVAGQACADKAERTTAFDREGAALFILGQLRRHGELSGEFLTAAAIEHGYRPHDARAFGPVFAKLKRQGLIVRVRECSRANGHGTGGGSVYRAA
jgi:hypothetical protein